MLDDPKPDILATDGHSWSGVVTTRNHVIRRRTRAAALETDALPKAVEGCLICGKPAPFVRQQADWGGWYRCSTCDLEFVQPRRAARNPADLFDAAYRGTELSGGFPDFALRVRQLSALLESPELWFWTPAFAQTLEWLDTEVPAGSRVFEIGCGLGFLLHALRRRGYEAEGLDIAATAVELNRHDGFRIWEGALDTLPTDWPTPAVVLAFFMLHHVEDPLQLLREARQRWPNARLVIAQYGPRNVDRHGLLAPRNLSRWSAASLTSLLSAAGYASEVRNLASDGTDRPGLRQARSAAFRLLVRRPGLYRASKRGAAWLLRPFRVISRRPSYVLLALATPLPENELTA